MKRQNRQRRQGVITLEWVLLVTVLCIGVLGAIGVVRNALVKEFAELTDAICQTDICP